MSPRSATWFAAGLLGLWHAPVLAGSPNQNHDPVWNFTGGADGANPRGDLLVDTAFNLYGTTPNGGASGGGTVFMVVPNAVQTQLGTLTTLYSFTGGADGSLPSAGVVADANGNLYGTTAMDGAYGSGTVFELIKPTGAQTAWTEQTLWGFGSAGDGRNPVGSLLFGSDGNLYGTTDLGGTYGFGTVFELSPPAGGSGAWTETILWNFTGGNDGASPVASLVFDANGALYGTTKAGGVANVGTAFQLIPSSSNGGWTENTLWNFTGGLDGSSPSGTLLPDGNGGFFGTTQFGGAVNQECDMARFPYYNEPVSWTAPAENAAYVPAGGNACGVVFDLSPPPGGGFPWNEKIIWGFTGDDGGANPVAGLVQDASGNLYAFVSEYGPVKSGGGIALQRPANQNEPWQMSFLTAFAGQHEGFFARGTPVFGLEGRLYGTLQFGGPSWVHVTDYGAGVLFTSVP